MRFGICINGDPSLIAKTKDYGYDYVEIALADFAKFSDEKIEELRAEMQQLGIWAETCNCFFFGFQKGDLTSANIDFAAIEEYIRMAFGKASRLGLKIAVIGSGVARCILDVDKREEGEENFAKVLRLAGDIGAEFGVQIVIEPLNQKECNEINTVAEGIAMCKRVNHPNVAVLADFFHVAMSGEGLDTIRSCGDVLKHVHIARGHEDRNMPVKPEDQADVAEWAAALKDNGYDSRISLEGGMWGDWDGTAIKMREVLKAFE